MGRARRTERGAYLIEGVVALGILLLIVAGIWQALVWQIHRAQAHSAVDQAVRAGALVNVESVPACEARLAQVLDNLARNVPVEASCATDGEVVTARVRFLESTRLLGLAPLDVDVTGLARKERVPGG